MVVAGLAVAVVAALVHVLIFALESLLWTGDRARAAFGTTAEQAEATKELAFNQGFYNLFLAIAVVLGTVLYAVGHAAVGLTLVLTGTGSMVAAALVLGISSPTKVGAAMKQGVVPAVAVLLLAVGLVL